MAVPCSYDLFIQMSEVAVTTSRIARINLYQSFPAFDNTCNLKGHGTFRGESWIKSGFCYPLDGAVQAGAIPSAC